MSYNLWKSFKAVLGLPMPALDDFLHGQCFEVTAHDVLFYVFSVYCTILLYMSFGHGHGHTSDCLDLGLPHIVYTVSHLFHRGRCATKTVQSGPPGFWAGWGLLWSGRPSKGGQTDRCS